MLPLIDGECCSGIPSERFTRFGDHGKFRDSAGNVEISFISLMHLPFSIGQFLQSFTSFNNESFLFHLNSQKPEGLNVIFCSQRRFKAVYFVV